ncbi:hypothetical protein EMQ25_15630 [Arsenicitalea aurantiaca]|uniref:DUF883 family protein n=1 Tax=Arsenicitalea aurantiaca TaxID=1783274 RepID=A0A433X431_9HYPH|nr:hypothetical protein [Arsenicitalea aurantiaca]RUT28818.1 hypothetical protein EMQ25_15630 [Arsenicitalea aurantiaca]
MSYSIEKIARRVNRQTRSSRHEMEDRLGEIRHDMAALADAVQAYGADALDHASDFASQVSRQGGKALARAGREARRAGSAVQRDPVPAIVAIGVVALVASLLAARR